MVICPDCGREVPEAKFCKNCGAYLPKIEAVEQASKTVEAESTPVLVNGEDTNYKVNYCTNCGFKLPDDYKFCPNCGYNLKSQVKTNTVALKNEKSMLLAIILSIFLPGLGQIYLGLDNKGSLLLVAYVISAILILIFIGIILVMIIWILALIDTIISFNALNRGEEVEDKLF